MYRFFFFTICCVLGGILPLLAVWSQSQPISQKARDLHFSSIVIDTHDDTTQRLLDPNFDLGVGHTDGSVDIPRMREGGLDAIFFSIYIPGSIAGPRAVQLALEQIEAVRRQVTLHPNDLALATTAAEVRSAFAAHKIAVLMGVEGGHMINDDLKNVDKFASLGVRYMTLTHMLNTDWADSSTDKPVHNGLTDFGKQVVVEMNRVGMIVDVSHIADKTFYDAIATSQAPVIASHSSCRALDDAPRNMTDDMIKALAAKRGVIQINYHVGFLSQEFRDADRAAPELGKAIEAETKKRCGDQEACQLIEADKILREYVAQGKLPRVYWTKIIDHIDHAVKLVGADHVGLGSDFDGADMPYGMEDATHLPQITNALLEKGYSDSDIQKILGGNTLRVMQEVENTSKKMGGKP
ncbi:MAG TPA: dipeptidase [Candidatus Binatus sp.]|nr:dipeptidase [Candidatus Binatus sp.]